MDILKITTNFLEFICVPKIIFKKRLCSPRIVGFVQQESVSFRKKLYLKVGGFDYKYNNSCDYGLWRSFSNIKSLETIFLKLDFLDLGLVKTQK